MPPSCTRTPRPNRLDARLRYDRLQIWLHLLAGWHVLVVNSMAVEMSRPCASPTVPPAHHHLGPTRGRYKLPRPPGEPTCASYCGDGRPAPSGADRSRDAQSGVSGVAAAVATAGGVGGGEAGGLRLEFSRDGISAAVPQISKANSPRQFDTNPKMPQADLLTLLTLRAQPGSTATAAAASSAASESFQLARNDQSANSGISRRYQLAGHMRGDARNTGAFLDAANDASLLGRTPSLPSNQTVELQARAPVIRVPLWLPCLPRRALRDCCRASEDARRLPLLPQFACWRPDASIPDTCRPGGVQASVEGLTWYGGVAPGDELRATYLALQYRFYTPPHLHRIWPSAGPINGGTNVTLGGIGFDGLAGLPGVATVCRFGSVGVKAVRQNGTHVECRTPRAPVWDGVLSASASVARRTEKSARHGAHPAGAAMFTLSLNGQDFHPPKHGASREEASSAAALERAASSPSGLASASGRSALPSFRHLPSALHGALAFTFYSISLEAVAPTCGGLHGGRLLTVRVSASPALTSAPTNITTPTLVSIRMHSRIAHSQLHGRGFDALGGLALDASRTPYEPRWRHSLAPPAAPPAAPSVGDLLSPSSERGAMHRGASPRAERRWSAPLPLRSLSATEAVLEMPPGTVSGRVLLQLAINGVDFEGGGATNPARAPSTLPQPLAPVPGTCVLLTHSLPPPCLHIHLRIAS